MEVGIPRALSYYTYFPFWYGFFTTLGIKVTVSDKTTKKTLNEGAALVVSETCLPVKVYVGHVLNLVEKGIKKIFVPSIQSIAPKIYNCSKIRGLPDLIRNVVDKDFELVEATYDKSEKGHSLYDFLKEIAAAFGITDFDKIRAAAKIGRKISKNFKLMTSAGLSFEKALEYAIEDKIVIPTKVENPFISVAVVAHGYNLYDDRVSMKIIEKLENFGIGVWTAEQLSDEQMIEGVSAAGSKLYWANELEVTGAASHFIQRRDIDGIIVINAFGCGPDSMMVERIARFAKEKSKPFLNLSVDEQTGEAGFITRIEAFTDMLARKKRRPGNKPTAETAINDEILAGIKNAR